MLKYLYWYHFYFIFIFNLTIKNDKIKVVGFEFSDRWV